MRCRLLVALAAAAVSGSITSGQAEPPAGVSDVDALFERGDLDSAGTVGIIDVLDLLANWAACP